jgi:MFS family permease
LALGFLFVDNIDQVWMFVAVSVALSSVSIFFFPARTALLPLILHKEQLLIANALAQLTLTLSFVVGAALAGLMVGIADATAPAFVADSLSFFVSAYFIARISISGRIAAAEKTGRVLRGGDRAGGPLYSQIRSIWLTLKLMSDELVVGLRYVFTDQVMRGVLISFLALMLGLGAANVTFIPLLVNELGMPEEGLGPVRLSQTIGIILGSALVTTSLAARRRAGDVIGSSMLAFGVMTVVVSLVQNYALMVGVLFLVGLCISPPQIVASTLMQRHVPSARLGRASGAQGTIVNVANIASMGAAGLLMDEIGARRVFTSAGVLIFVAGIVSWWVLRGVEDVPDDVDESVSVEETPSPPESADLLVEA